MWRTNSDGELYLYAPKDKQTPEVCNTPPRSICEADYGLSIGRGSFRFTPGQWTHVSQTVVLNTPGKQDGYFTLDVNGERIMDLSGLYYRQIADEDWDDDDGDKYESERVDGAGDIDSHEDSTSPNGGNASGQDSGTSNELEEQGGLLGHILAAPPKIVVQPSTKSRIYNAWKTHVTYSTKPTSTNCYEDNGTHDDRSSLSGHQNTYDYGFSGASRKSGWTPRAGKPGREKKSSRF
ncbi:unnamed protein product [Rhizoctonia solani]|uniref:Polysaccharide lyase 14 domain-containing protein n=1 Tax=Rhizoctonia solani TaxID=456999 RepID=A0A8H3HI35_9AGAM|nr:unnamed protein product [Rhizoctonia solani]